MKTCKYCGEKYDDTWRNWWSKYCCKKCYETSETKYKIGDKVYSYYDTKVGVHGLLTALLTEGTVSQIYKLNRPSTNGLYQYAVDYYNPIHKKYLTTYKFVHQVFENEKDCILYIDIINERRKINKEAREKIKLFT